MRADCAVTKGEIAKFDFVNWNNAVRIFCPLRLNIDMRECRITDQNGFPPRCSRPRSRTSLQPGVFAEEHLFASPVWVQVGCPLSYSCVCRVSNCPRRLFTLQVRFYVGGPDYRFAC